MFRGFLSRSLALALILAPLQSPCGEDGALERQLNDAASAEAREEFAAARKLYEQTVKEYPESAEAWAALGEHLRFYAHDSQGAAAAFKKALNVPKPEAHATAFAYRGLGELAAKDGHIEVALDDFKKSADAQPIADTYRSICHLYCTQRKFKEAAEAAGEAVKFDPNDAIARLLYAAQLYRAGQTEQARKEYDAAASAHGIGADGSVKRPIHCCVLYNAAGYMGVSGEKQLALKLLREFLETPNHRHLTRQEIEQDADFESIKSMPEFEALLDKHYNEPVSASKQPKQ
ncbi:MAG TPA: tetratricopeptide repeat protein [Planctomycetota bacterium]|nr:tetratricopeptide repeat protein [Planctomycetota bacterium]